jgi:hypothetical protein
MKFFCHNFSKYIFCNECILCFTVIDNVHCYTVYGMCVCMYIFT